MSQVCLSQHPLVLHKLSHLRNEKTETKDFRQIMNEVSYLLAYEATAHLSLKKESIQTPLCESPQPFLSEKAPAVISILRAGNGLLEGFLKLMPEAPVGYLGLYREEKAKKIVQYYKKLPDLSDRRALVIDPMLATGKSAVKALELIKEDKPKGIDFVCLLASKPGLELLQKEHPDVQIFAGAMDPELDEKAYIVPGLGDAGDRLFGTL